MVFKSRRAQRWFERINGSRHMLWFLGVVSFLETIIVPIPIEVVLIPLMALNRDRIWRIPWLPGGGVSRLWGGCGTVSVCRHLVH